MNREITQDGDDEIVTIPLLRGREFLILTDPADDDVPDADEIAEMRMQARQRRNPKTLSLGDQVEVLVQTVATYIASGVVGNAAWAMFPAIVRYATRHKPNKRPALPLEELRPLVIRCCTGALGAAPVRLRISSQKPVEEGRGWILAGDADDTAFQLTTTADGSVNIFELT